MIDYNWLDEWYVRLQGGCCEDATFTEGKVYRSFIEGQGVNKYTLGDTGGKGKMLYAGLPRNKFWRKATYKEVYDSYMKYGATDVEHGGVLYSFYSQEIYKRTWIPTLDPTVSVHGHYEGAKTGCGISGSPDNPVNTMAEAKKVIDKYEGGWQPIETAGLIDSMKFNWADPPTDKDTYTILLNTNGETKMLNIQTVVQINGQNSSGFGDDELIELINGQQRGIDSLQSTQDKIEKGESKKIKSLIEQRRGNIVRLTELLDNGDGT